MIDVHIHLDDDKYSGEYESIIADFAKCNIDFVINDSVNLDTMLFSCKLAEKHDRVYFTVGFHPEEIDKFDDNAEQVMRQLATHPKCVSVGEIGLDYHYTQDNKQAQKEVFVRQLQIAHDCSLPVTLHIRDAIADADELLRRNEQLLDNGVLLHCYSGSAEQARQFAKRGYYFSFGGALTFKGNKKNQVLQAIPIQQVLTETDGPYMTPEPFRGQTNRPEYIRYVLQQMASAYNVETDVMEQQIKENALRLFKKIKR